MDQDKEVKKAPKYTEHYKDIEKRKEYQRGYQLDRYHRMKALKNLPKEDEMSTTTTTPESDMEFQKALKGITTALGPDDPVAKFINKVEPFLPLAQMFLKGFVDARNDHQKPSEAPQGPQAPPGWTGISPLEKLNKKYNSDGSISSYWQQGIYYDQWTENNATHGQIKGHMPVDMEETYQGHMEAAKQRRINQMRELTGNGAPPLTQYKNMEEINRNSNTWDKKEDAMDMSNAIEVQRSDGQPSNINEAIKQKEGITPEDAVQTLEAVKTVMQEDAKKYIDLILNYFKTRPIDQFEQDLNNINETITKFKPMMDLLPFQAKETFKTISAKDLEQKLKEQDPSKHALIVKKKLKKKLYNLWDELKNSL